MHSILEAEHQTPSSFHFDDRAQKMKNYILTGEPHGSDHDIKNDGQMVQKSGELYEYATTTWW